MANGEKNKAVIGVSVEARLDRKSLARTMKELDAIGKTSKVNIQQINDISKAIDKFGKNLSNQTKGVGKNLQSLADELEKAHEAAAELESAYSGAKDSGSKNKFRTELEQMRTKIVGLNKSIEDSRKLNQKAGIEFKGMMIAQQRYQKSLENAASYDYSKDFKSSLKSFFSGNFSGALKQAGSGIRGATEKKVALGEISGGGGKGGLSLGTLTSVIGGLGMAASAMSGFVALLAKASSSASDFNKALLSGSTLANEYGARSGQLTKSINNLRESAIRSNQSFMRLGVTTEDSLKNIAAFSREASGSVIQTEAQLKSMGKGNLDVGLLEFTKNAQIYGKALGMEATEVASLMGKLVSEIGIHSDNVQSTLGNIVKQAAQAGMPVSKFMSIFHEAVPNLDLFTNRIEELTGTMKMLSKTMDPRAVKGFMQAMGRGFDQMDFRQRLKTALIVGPGKVKKIMERDIESATKAVKTQLDKSGLGEEFAKIMGDEKIKNKQDAISRLAAKGAASGTVQGATISEMQRLARYKDLSGGGVLKQSTGMREMGFLARMETIEELAGRFTGGDITGLGEHVAKQVGVSENEYKALIDLKASMGVYMSSIQEYGLTSSKSINDGLEQIYAGNKELVALQSKYRDKDEGLKAFLKDKASTEKGRKELERSIKEASAKQITTQTAEIEKQTATMEDIAIEQVDATLSITDKLQNVIRVILEKIFSSFNEVLSYLDSFFSKFMGDSGAVQQLKNWSLDAKNIFGGNEAGLQKYRGINDQLVSAVQSGSSSEELMGKFAPLLKSVRKDGKLGDKEKENLSSALSNLFPGQLSALKGKFISNMESGNWSENEKYLQNANPEDLAKFLSALALQSSKKITGPAHTYDESKRTKAQSMTAKQAAALVTGTGTTSDLETRIKQNAIGQRVSGGVQNTKQVKQEAKQQSTSEQSNEILTGIENKQESANSIATAHSQSTSDVLDLMKKGIKLDNSWLRGDYSTVIKESTLSSFRTALTEFLYAYLMAGQGDFSSLMMSAIESGHAINDIVETKRDREKLQGLASKATNNAMGGLIGRTGLHYLSAGETVLPRGVSGSDGARVLNVGGIHISVRGQQDAQSIRRAVISALDEIHRRH